ncbi:MAG: hypothetical protein EBY16_07270 [Gammaproteobacteria bacterium]|nr:hypothetical protein [Gammaproteobacteria bacterium]
MFGFIALHLLATSPLLFNILFLSDIIIDLVEKMANPLNLIIKPLTKELNLSNNITSMIFCATLLIGGASLIFLNQITLIIIQVALNLITLYQSGLMFYNIYQQSPQFFYISLACFLAQALIIIFVGLPEPENVISNVWADIFVQIGNILFLCKFNQILADVSLFVSEIYLNLPLPQEKTNPEFVNIINENHKTAFLSHCYFNTPEDDEFENADRSDSLLESFALR